MEERFHLRFLRGICGWTPWAFSPASHRKPGTMWHRHSCLCSGRSRTPLMARNLHGTDKSVCATSVSRAQQLEVATSFARRPPSAACWSGSWTESPARTSRSCRRHCRGSRRRWLGRWADEKAYPQMTQMNADGERFYLRTSASSADKPTRQARDICGSPAARPFGFAQGRLPPGQPARRQRSGRDRTQMEYGFHLRRICVICGSSLWIFQSLKPSSPASVPALFQIRAGCC